MRPKSGCSTDNGAMSPRFQKIAALALFVLVSGFYSQSSLYKKIEESISLPVLFYAREAISPNRSLSPKIKIFAWDDVTYKKMGDFLSTEIEGLEIFFEAICARKPRAVVIDKLFATDKISDVLIESMRKIFNACQVVNIAWIGDESSASTDPALDLSRFAIGPAIRQSKKKLRHASSKVLPLIGGIGLASKKKPGYFLGAGAAGKWVFPHVGLFASKSIEVDDKSVVLQGSSSPFHVDETLFLNWLRPDKYYDSTFQALKAIEIVKSGRPMSIVEEGDFVLVLPSMFTGTADVHQSPFGEVLGGFALATVADSVFKNIWLKVVSLSLLWVLIGIFTGLFIGLSGRSMRSSVFYIFSANVFVVLLVVLLFLLAHRIIFFFQPLLAFNVVALWILLDRYRQKEIKNMRYHQALQGIVSGGDLEYIKRNPDKVDLRPVEQEVTSMFVDFVSFSTFAEQTDPTELFQNLNMSLNLLSSVVHKHQGIVDKSLGDGLL